MYLDTCLPDKGRDRKLDWRNKLQNQDIKTLLDPEIDAVTGGLTAQGPTPAPAPESILCWLTGICADRPPLITINPDKI